MSSTTNATVAASKLNHVEVLSANGENYQIWKDEIKAFMEWNELQTTMPLAFKDEDIKLIRARANTVNAATTPNAREAPAAAAAALEITQINTHDNVADIFTKSLDENKHWKFVHALGLRRKANVA
ncbi:uncharacterized protein EV422DRAFT_607859 [Fimicolochytrium jonesii]|uniref:uncharacterized protein n=1 Tax=Fimicolochytrium jonesii TaxID=1396493 RepID=UPI0022FE579F|nr:uncharacterized protein EV422DRAFT_607859 [Fimicolochytrium jonesii]KAI8816637.1 hypothetical protein EV422DRAFT_607859 [Fimicolochytrium jonesii]